MGLKSFFKKLTIGFSRLCEPSIPYTSQAKKYGNRGEDWFVDNIKGYLPGCRIKRNVVIETFEGYAEIDCLILYNNKLFAVEIKRWKGKIVEREDCFIQKKVDRWTDEIHIKRQKSPFKQLGRAIYLLRKQIPEKVWINAIVYFEDADSVAVCNENVWFSKIEDLIYYIKTAERTSLEDNANRFFDKCITADYLYSYAWGKSLLCVISDDCLRFNTQNRILTRNEIRSININHHWSYDDLLITCYDGSLYNVGVENGKVRVRENGRNDFYALCKLDYIELGKR